MTQLISTLTRVIPLAIGLIGAVEKIYGAVTGKGEDKKQAYIDGLMVALGVTEGVLSRDLVNDEEFKRLAGNVADAVIGLNNFIRDHKARVVAEDKEK